MDDEPRWLVVVVVGGSKVRTDETSNEPGFSLLLLCWCHS
jgi:hypothetical protein